MTELNLPELRRIAEEREASTYHGFERQMAAADAFVKAFSGEGVLALLDEIERLTTITDAQVEAAAKVLMGPDHGDCDCEYCAGRAYDDARAALEAARGVE